MIYSRFPKTATLMALTIFFSGCASFSVKPLPPLNGMIYDADNKPVSEVRVEVNGDHVATSDVQGHFTLSNLKDAKQNGLTASKNGYETTSLNFIYTNATQVLYIRMISGEHLVDEAERAIAGKKWADARSLLERADSAGGDQVSTGYLRAGILSQTKKHAEAASLLENLRAGGANEPYIDLFLADLYEYRLADPEKTREALVRFLASKADDDVERRLE